MFSISLVTQILISIILRGGITDTGLVTAFIRELKRDDIDPNKFVFLQPSVSNILDLFCVPIQ